jgi:hypothetical protein
MGEEDFKTDFNDKSIIVKQARVKPHKEIYKQRKPLCEHPFGAVKRAMDGGCCLLKGKGSLQENFHFFSWLITLKELLIFWESIN